MRVECRKKAGLLGTSRDRGGYPAQVLAGKTIAQRRAWLSLRQLALLKIPHPFPHAFSVTHTHITRLHVVYIKHQMQIISRQTVPNSLKLSVAHSCIQTKDQSKWDDTRLLKHCPFCPTRIINISFNIVWHNVLTEIHIKVLVLLA